MELSSNFQPLSGMGVPLGVTNTYSKKRTPVASPPDFGMNKRGHINGNRALSALQNVFMVIKRREGSFEKVSLFYI